MTSKATESNKFYNKLKATDPVGLKNMERMARGQKAVSGTEVAGFLSGTFKRVLNQEIVDGFNTTANPWGTIFVDETWANGIKEFFNQTLFEISDFDEKADIVIKDFNPDSNTITSYVEECDIEKYLSFVVYATEFIDNFTSPAKIFAYAQGRLNQARKTWTDYLISVRANTLLQTTKKSMTITYDKTINTNGKDTSGVVDLLREYIMNLGTPSKNHLGTPVDGYLYSAVPENLIIVASTKFMVEMSRQTAPLFNKEDVLLKPKIFFWNFDEYVPSARKGKIQAFVLDKKAFRNGMQYRMNSTIKLPKFRIMMEEAYKHKLIRVKKLAIAIFEDTGASRMKRDVPKMETPKMETPKKDSTKGTVAP